jgi:hypothetical protein
MIRLSFGLLLIMLVSGCKSTYLPNTRNVSLFREAKEAMVTVAVASGVDVQTAYALTDNIGVMGNVNANQSTYQTNDGVDYKRNYRFGELGLGFFGKSRSARYELYGGYGLGQGTSYEALYLFIDAGTKAVVSTGKFNRIFLQPTIATNARNFNISLTTRFSMVDFTQFESDGVIKKPNEGFHFFLEPSLTTTFKMTGNLRGFFQLNINNPIPSDPYFEFERFNAAIGIQLHTGSLRTRVY